MKKRNDFFKLNNKGASLVTVIITIGVVMLLVSVVMMTSAVNYKMKRVNAYAKDTFYSAEQVLDEINIGLQRLISDSISMAYMDVMQNYSDYTVEQKKLVLQSNYYENMWDKLQADAGHKKYKVSTLEDFLKDSTKWQGDDQSGYGAIVRAVVGDDPLATEGDMETYDTGIILKNLRITYKDSKGFVSVIQTDIRLTYPNMDFAATTELPEISSYGVIADAGMITMGNADLLLEGNFYADSFESTGTVNGSPKKITHVGDGDVIVKKEMQLKNASFSNDAMGSLWANDIVVNGGVISLFGETNLADDLNIKGDGSDVTLSGIYNGFGNSISDSEKSSAILINGTNASLNLTGIEKITVAGHAYIGTKSETQSNEEGEAEEEAVVNENNIYTGESIAVKSNQLMYMIPPECIGVDKTTGKSLFNKNPLTSAEYNTIKGDPEHYIEVSPNVDVEKLGGALGEYIYMMNGVAQPEIVFVPTTGNGNGPLVYYYMRFENEGAANRYFATYYNKNKEVYDEYIKSYIELLEFPTTAAVTRIKLAANGIYGGDTTGYTMIPYTVEGASTQLAGNQVMYQEQFTALCTKLTDNYAKLTNLELAPSAKGQIVFDNIVDKNMLQAFISGGGGSDYLEIADEEQGIVILTTKPELTVSDSNVHLVISTGNVTIDMNNFEGTVFTDGTVTTSEIVFSIKVKEETVNAMLRYFKEIDGQNVMVAQVLRDGKDYVFDIDDGEDSDKKTTTLSDLIIYENWKKE